MTGWFRGQFSGLPFGTAAEAYDRLRPGYPADLVDVVLARAFPAGTPTPCAAEAGAGTGIATRAFAARGVRVTAYEPDPQMAALARDRCAGLPVRVEESRFEDATGGGVPLVFSAQAWHWIDPAVRYDVAASLLRPGGTLALFWTVDQLIDAEAGAAVEEAYAAIAPIAGWAADLAAETNPMTRWPAAELVAHPTFTDVAAQRFRWERTLPTDEFLAYLATHSTALRLDDDTRARLFAAVGDAVRRTLPDDVRLAEETTLYLASRA